MPTQSATILKENTAKSPSKNLRSCKVPVPETPTKIVGALQSLSVQSATKDPNNRRVRKPSANKNLRSCKPAMLEIETPSKAIANALQSLSVQSATKDTNNRRRRGPNKSRSPHPFDTYDDEKENVPPKDCEERVTRSRSRSRSRALPIKDLAFATATPARVVDPSAEIPDAFLSPVESKNETSPSTGDLVKPEILNVVTPIRLKYTPNRRNMQIVKKPKEQVHLKRMPSDVNMEERDCESVSVSISDRTRLRSASMGRATATNTRTTNKRADLNFDESDDDEDFMGGNVKATVNKAKVERSPSRAAYHRTAHRACESLHGVISRLHTAEVPDSLPCREEEVSRVEQFILSCVRPNSRSQSMYISGVPGTGKTATVQAVVRKLEKTKSVPNFIYLYVNAMELIDPKMLFVDVYKGVSGSTARISAQLARRKLNQMFDMTDRKRPPIILLIDELDHMCTKRQELIYDVFNWTTNETGRVNVIAIANTLDLPERLLSQKVTSRLGSNRMAFHPYEHTQIEKIIEDRLKGSKAVDEKAVELASRKVAAMSGDVRRAIDILRRAAEIAVERKEQMLTMKHVLNSIQESTSTVRAGLISGMSKHSLTMFRAAVSQVQATGVEEFTMYELYKQYCILCTQLEGVAPHSETVLRKLVALAASNRILVTSPGRNWWTRRIRLGLSIQEAQFCINHALDARKADGA